MLQKVPLVFVGVLLLLQAAMALDHLDVEPTAGGFRTAFKGWSSFALQAFKRPDFPYGDMFLTEANLRAQAEAQAKHLLPAGYDYFMIDSGWSHGSEGDANGRIVPNTTIFRDFPGFVSDLHDMGLKVGIYVVPGVFGGDYDANKQIAGSDYRISDVGARNGGNNQGRVKIDFDAGGQTAAAGNAWVKSVVDQFAGWGIDLIKMDYLLPHTSGEEGNGDSGTHFGEARAYRNAINKSQNPKMWFLESYALAIGEPDLPHWRETGDSFRIATDVNNSPSNSIDDPSTMVSWFAVQRTIEAYRIYMGSQLHINRPLKGYPDLDAVLIGNTGALNMLSAPQRRTYVSFWIVTGVPIYSSDDLTRLDDSNLALLTHREINAIHQDWTSSVSPATFINPNDGSRNPAQLQVWAAGPFGDSDEVIVMLANMGCPEKSNINVGYSECLSGSREVVAKFKDLQITGSHCNRDVWAGRDTGRADTQVSRKLGGGESVIFKLTPVAKGGSC